VYLNVKQKIITTTNLSHPGNYMMQLPAGSICDGNMLRKDLGDINYEFALKQGWIKLYKDLTVFEKLIILYRKHTKRMIMPLHKS